MADRCRVIHCLEDEAFPASRDHRFTACGTEPVVFESADEAGKFKVGCKRCHDRFCLPCAQDRARLILGNLEDQRPPGPIRFLTLTLKHSKAPLAEQLDRLYKAFQILRRRKLWKDRVTGGAAFCEVKIAKDGESWHPHLHVMLQGKFLAQKAVSDAWLEVTGDSFVVDIRMAKGQSEVARYLTKYVTKGWANSLLRRPAALKELMLAFVGRKMVMTFGSWAKLKLLAPPEPGTWIALGTLQQLIEQARAGDTAAAGVLATINHPNFIAPLEAIDDIPMHSP